VATKLSAILIFIDFYRFLPIFTDFYRFLLIVRVSSTRSTGGSCGPNFGSHQFGTFFYFRTNKTAAVRIRTTKKCLGFSICARAILYRTFRLAHLHTPHLIMHNFQHILFSNPIQLSVDNSTYIAFSVHKSHAKSVHCAGPSYAVQRIDQSMEQLWIRWNAHLEGRT
jgi:hypothetical protein